MRLSNTTGCRRPRASHLHFSDVPVRLPSHCETYNQRALSGFALQHCVGVALGSRLPPEPSEELNVLTATCVGERLLAAGLIDDCHLVAHGIGEAAWRVHESQHWWQATVASLLPSSHMEEWLLSTSRALLPGCARGCWDGCMHAVLIELVLAALRSPASLARLVEGSCDAEIAGAQADLERWLYGCHHGVGHGLGEAVHIGLISTARGLALCDNSLAFHGGRAPETCKQGLTMQLVDRRIQQVASAAERDAVLSVSQAAAEAAGSEHVGIAPLPSPLTWSGVCDGVPSDGGDGDDSAADQQLRRDCFDMLGEGLMFATCHDGAFSLTACVSLTTDQRAIDTISSRRVTHIDQLACSGGAREEGSTAQTTRNSVRSDLHTCSDPEIVDAFLLGHDGPLAAHGAAAAWLAYAPTSPAPLAAALSLALVIVCVVPTRWFCCCFRARTPHAAHVKRRYEQRCGERARAGSVESLLQSSGGRRALRGGAAARQYSAAPTAAADEEILE